MPRDNKTWNARNKNNFGVRRYRETYDTYAGCRLLSEELEGLKRVAKLLNVSTSDLLRGLILGMSAIAEFSAQSEDSIPPTTSDKIRYV
jgi:hypothetical protein